MGYTISLSILSAIIAVASGLEDNKIKRDQFAFHEEEFERPGPEVYIQIDPKDDPEWMQFKKTYNKTYKDEWEEVARRRNWEDNVRFINKHNAEFLRGIHTYWTATQEYSDLSLEEFMKLMTGPILTEERVMEYPPVLEEEDLTLPKSVDWTSRGYVTTVKSQGRCGASVVFAAVGATESQTRRQKGYLPFLSEQQVIDCCNDSPGCHGGYLGSTYRCISKQGGIDLASCYANAESKGQCRYKAVCKGSSVKSVVKIGRSEYSLQEAIANTGPASVAVDVNSRAFMNYRGGVFNNPNCSKNPNHAVLCTGYGTKEGQQYWTIKNSWGIRWGQHGYIYMSRNRNNQCGIANHAAYPIIG